MTRVERDKDGTVQRIIMHRPSNFHAHLRQGPMMRAIAKHIMRQVKYLLVMPNTGPIRTVAEALQYHDELMAIAEAEGLRELQLIMTLYYTEALTPKVIEKIAKQAIVRAIKYYPPDFGATTGSGFGIPLRENDDRLRAMEEMGVPLLGHFESVSDKHGRILPHVEREGYFMKHEYPWLRKWYPNLRICIEHASTEIAVEAVRADTSGNTVLTATPQHMLLNLKAFRLPWAGNHLKCMPILKSEDDRWAVFDFVTSGDWRAIAGDDTAAWLSEKKEGPFETAASGCFWTHSIAAYALAFERAGALDERFGQFMSTNGADWWGLPHPSETDVITLRYETERDIPDPVEVPEEGDVVIPLGWDPSPENRLHIGLAVEN